MTVIHSHVDYIAAIRRTAQHAAFCTCADCAAINRYEGR
jgi:hypothetical protein